MGFFDKLKGETEEKQLPKEKLKTKKKVKIESLPAEAEAKAGKPEKKLSKTEGELAIDVYEAANEFIIQSTIAGVKAEDLDIAVENDMVTIRGERQQQKEEIGKKYYYQECYWGAFSRQVILPEEVDGSRTQATMKDGVLTLRIPKLSRKKKKKITVHQEE